MAGVDGEWNTVIKAPTGEQKTKLKVVSAGDAFKGEFSGPDGMVEIGDGKVDGSSLSWSMVITKAKPHAPDSGGEDDPEGRRHERLSRREGVRRLPVHRDAGLAFPSGS